MGKNIGFLIDVDGPNGAGKTTLVKNLTAALTSIFACIGVNLGEALRSGRPVGTVPVAALKEPDGTPLASDIRRILFSDEDMEIDNYTRLLLYCAAKRDVYLKHLFPLLADGCVVVKDRGDLSTYAYQSDLGLGKVPYLSVRDMLRAASDNTLPNLMLFVTAPPEVLEERLAKRGDGSHGGYVTDYRSIFNTHHRYEETVWQLEHGKNVANVYHIEHVDGSLDEQGMLVDALKAVRFHLSSHFQEDTERVNQAVEGHISKILARVSERGRAGSPNAGLRG